ncbi:MAG TPA: hypothetical protein VGV37_26650 [Aliidongia sp.]|uniref:hypothetical protein n=1 Tax=Aliidongia sp. TaxID=1914230 RepID=UPI002DDD3F55|nr:hypothetical protein [Aliidongia sp.]HEV2678136.1 hypothetical protein [Aliidongia sp.]
MSPEKKYLDWRKGLPVGCMFARIVSLHPERHEQAVERLSGIGTPDTIATRIADRVQQLIDAPDVSAAALLFPGISSLARLCRVALALGEKPRWSVTTSPLENTPAGKMVAIHVARDLQFGDGWVPSEVLILGPFENFPATRRAPIVGFEIFLGAPLPSDPKTGQPTVKVNLAHMKLPTLTQTAFDKAWDKSVVGRLASLGGVEDGRAKAKVSFTVPVTLARQLGCAP